MSVKKMYRAVSKLLIQVGENVFTKTPATLIPCLLISCNAIGLSIFVIFVTRFLKTVLTTIR